MSVDSIPTGTVVSAEEITRKLCEAARHVEEAQGLLAMASGIYQEAENPSFAPNGVVGMVPLLDLVGRELHRQSSDWRSIAAARKQTSR